MDLKIDKALRNSEDNIYVSVRIQNDTDAQIDATLQTTLQDPFLSENAGLYEGAVVNFSLPVDLVPILIVDPLPGAVDASTTLSITFEYLGVNVRKYVQYIPPNDIISKTAEYYSIFNYSHMVELINNTFLSCFTASTLPIGCTAAPYMIFNPTTGLFSIIAQTSYGPSSGVKIYFNRKLWQLFDGFHSKLLTLPTNNSDGRAHQIIIMSNYQNNITIPTGAPGAGSAAYIMTQDFSSLLGWNSIKSIIIISNIGLREEIQQSISLNGKILNEATIAEFPIDGIRAEDRVIVYEPSALRYHDVTTNDKTTSNLNIAFWMVDKKANKYRVYINPGDMAQVKFNFRKKAQKTIIL
jgi:hypothetical protein